MEMKLVLELGGETHAVTVRGEGDAFVVELGDRLYHIDATGAAGSDVLSLLVGGESVEAWTVPNGGGYRVSVLGESFDVDVEDALRAQLRKLDAATGGTKDEVIKAPMPGVVVEIKARQGDTVEGGEALIIVEAMKMRNEFGPKRSGVLHRIAVEVGQSVERGTELAVVRPAATDAPEEKSL